MKGEKLFWGAGTELTISYQDDGSIDHGAIPPYGRLADSKGHQVSVCKRYIQ